MQCCLHSENSGSRIPSMAIAMDNNENNDYCLKGVWRWRYMLALVAICGVSLFFSLRGITFGLPSEERLNISIGGRDEMIRKLPELSDAINRGLAERSEALAKEPENFVELSQLSPYFDQVRSNNPDEFFVFKNISYMVKNRTLVPNLFDYGAFYFYKVGSALLVGRLLGVIDTGQSAEHYLLYPDEIAPFYIVGRTLSAIMLMLTVAVVFLAGYRVGRFPVAVFSSLLFVLIPLVSLTGKSMKVEASLLFYSAMALFFALPALRRARWRDYLLSGVFVGLATAVKYPGVFSCAYLVMFHLLRRRIEWMKQNPQQRKFFTDSERMLVAAGLLSMVAFFSVNFGVLFNFGAFYGALTGLATGCSRGGNALFNLFDGLLRYYEDAWRYTLGIPAAAIITAAVLYRVARPNPLWLGCLPVLILYWVFASQGIPPAEAYFLPALPALVLITVDWWNRLASRKLRILLAAAVVVGTLSYTWAYSQVSVQRNVRLVAAEWINHNIPEGSIICTRRYPVFFRTPVVSPNKFRLVDQFMHGEEIVHTADYYVQTSYQWDCADFFQRLREGEDKPPAPGFVRIKEFEVTPRAFFGLLPLSHPHRLTPFIENLCPKIIVFKRIGNATTPPGTKIPASRAMNLSRPEKPRENEAR